MADIFFPASKFRRFLAGCGLVLIAAYLAVYAALWLTLPNDAVLAQIREGDLLFQTAASRQSSAIMLASYSPYDHVGMAHFEDGVPYVLEAVSPTRKTPLRDFVSRSLFGRLTVKRIEGATPDDFTKASSWALAHLGMPYDFYFYTGGNAYYCSEFVYDAFAAAGLKLGAFQKIKDLHLDNAPVKKVIAQRWQNYPLCIAGKEKDFAACWAVMREQSLITPAALAADKRLQTVYTNYLFWD